MYYKNLNDYEICYYVNENDDYALELLYEKYTPLINKMCNDFYKTHRDIGIDLDDLKQEARIALLKAVKNYQADNTMFFTYVSMCINRHLISYCRNYNAYKNYPLNHNIGFDDSNKSLIAFSNDLCADEIIIENELFFACRNYLKFDQSIIFEMKYNGFSYKEMSELLDLPISTIDGRISMIRKKLKNNFKYSF